MTYILTTLLFGLGVWFQIMQKIRSLRLKFPDFSAKRIFATYFQEEWDSLGVSFLVWLCCEIGLYIAEVNNVVYHRWFQVWGMYALSLVLGYAGQRLAYRYLGTAEKVLQKKADQISNNNDLTGQS